MDHVNETCEVRHMSVGGLPRCVALMVVLAIDAEKCSRNN